MKMCVIIQVFDNNDIILEISYGHKLIFISYQRIKDSAF